MLADFRNWAQDGLPLAAKKVRFRRAKRFFSCWSAVLKNDLMPLGIAVHDHIIVGRNGHASMKGLRLI
jgi:hypothetical protein